MNKLFLLCLLMVFAIAFTGCGGDGDDDDNGIDPNTSLIGTWQPISATANGIIVKVSEVLPDTDVEATRWEVIFRQNGTVSFRAFNTNGTLIEEINGQWDSDNQVATVVLDGETTIINWSDVGDVVTVNYTLDGSNVESKWVRTVPIPTAREATWVGSWQAQSVLVNGVAVPLATFFEWEAGSTSEVLILEVNGTATLQERENGTIEETETGTWASEDGVFTFVYDGDRTWGYWEGQLLVLTYLDPVTGNTIRTTWAPLNNT